MVKVKAKMCGDRQEFAVSFNHPMVKVKVKQVTDKKPKMWFQPPYGES